MTLCDGIAVFAGKDSPLTQTVGVALGLPWQDVLHGNTLYAFYERYQQPVTIEYCPLADATLLRWLQKEKFAVVEFTNVMYRPMSSFEERPEIDADEEITISYAQDKPNWPDLIAAGFTDGRAYNTTFLQIFSTFQQIPFAFCMQAALNGEPVGGGLMVINDTVGWFYAFSTLPRGRGRGVQSALIDQGLAYLQQRGCKYGAVVVEPGTVSQRNFERQGFRVAYTRCKMVKQL